MLKYALDHDRGVPGPAGPWGVKGGKPLRGCPKGQGPFGNRSLGTNESFDSGKNVYGE